MDELKPKKAMERKRLLEYIIIFLLILSGNILDIADFYISTVDSLFLIQQDMMREFRTLGLVLLALIHIPYENIKIKSFTFMFAIWAVITIIHNNFYDMMPNTLSYILYGCYLLWIVRIALIKDVNRDNQLEQVKRFEISGIAYNILLPVKTFRGLIQVLFLPWKNARYETRILVANHKITGVKNKKFVQVDYCEDYIKCLIERGFRISECKNYNKKTVDGLMGKKLILGFRDCRRLEL